MQLAAEIAKSEDVMTDFQFKAIMAMVLEMLGKCETIEELAETKKAIAKLSGELGPQDDKEV